MAMNAYAGKCLAAALVILALCATLCLAQEAAPVESVEEIETDTGESAGGDMPGGDAPSDSVKAKSLRVELPVSVLLPGEQTRGKVTFSPAEAGAHPVEWSSSDPRVASVNDNGVVRAQPGAIVPDEGLDVDIWARATDGSLAMNCATVRIMPSVRGLRVVQPEIALSLAGEGFAGVAVEIEPAQLLGVAIIRWLSSDASVATVRESGAGEVALIYAVAPGQAIITAEATDGSGRSDSLTVTVQ